MRKLLIAALAGATMLIGAQSAAASDRELADPGRYPGGLPCASNGSGAIACFQSNGDKIWIKDDGDDGHSAIAVWQHYLGDGAYRKGYCRNALGYGRWGVCNKQLSEDSYFEWWAVEYDAETGQWSDWSNGNSAIS
jgi:hypothetical protein